MLSANKGAFKGNLRDVRRALMPLTGQTEWLDNSGI